MAQNFAEPDDLSDTVLERLAEGGGADGALALASTAASRPRRP